MIESLWPRATWAINASPTEKPVGADELHGVLPDRQVLKGAFPAHLEGVPGWWSIEWHPRVAPDSANSFTPCWRHVRAGAKAGLECERDGIRNLKRGLQLRYTSLGYHNWWLSCWRGNASKWNAHTWCLAEGASDGWKNCVGLRVLLVNTKRSCWIRGDHRRWIFLGLRAGPRLWWSEMRDLLHVGDLLQRPEEPVVEYDAQNRRMSNAVSTTDSCGSCTGAWNALE